MEKMEINGRNPDLKGNGNHSSGDSNIKSNEMPTFVNHAEIAWHERRREWVGDCSGNMQQVPMEPILSWTTTYEDLLSTAEPFQQPIPLAVRKWWTSWLISGMKMISMIRGFLTQSIRNALFFFLCLSFQGFYSFFGITIEQI